MGPQAESATPRSSAHLLLFDGVCGVCSRVPQFFLRHDRRGRFAFATLQSAIGRRIVARHGGDPDELTTMYVVASYGAADERIFTKSDAALLIARDLGWPWRLLTLFRVVPRRVRNRLYDAVARNRYRVFGKNQSCMVPTAELRHRFLE
jgi:predicted DCC family thiol-disulfide oxidoreductase YuxK